MSMSYFPEHVSALYDRKKELKKVEFKLLILQPWHKIMLGDLARSKATAKVL